MNFAAMRIAADIAEAAWLRASVAIQTIDTGGATDTARQAVQNAFAELSNAIMDLEMAEARKSFEERTR